MNLSQVFTHISDYALSNQSKREFLTDKKTGCVYHVAYRSKNCHRGAPGRGEQNTESMCLEIDPNRSPSFSLEEIDLVSGRSVTCNLTGLEQGSIGRTKLTMSVFYIDEQQALQERVRVFYMETVGGTIAKRLEAALVAFHKEAQATINEINSRGFENKRIEKTSYYASYFALRGKGLDSKRGKREDKIICDVWSDYDNNGLNIMLYIYSILNGNILHGTEKIHYLSNHFIEVKRYDWKPRKHLYTQAETAELEAIMEYYRVNRKMIQDLINECSRNVFFDETKFRERLKFSKHVEEAL